MITDFTSNTMDNQLMVPGKVLYFLSYFSLFNNIMSSGTLIYSYKAKNIIDL